MRENPPPQAAKSECIPTCRAHICPHLLSVPQDLPTFSQLPPYALVASAPLTIPAKQRALQKVDTPVGSRARETQSWTRRSGWGGGKLRETPGGSQVHWDPRSGSWLERAVSGRGGGWGAPGTGFPGGEAEVKGKWGGPRPPLPWSGAVAPPGGSQRATSVLARAPPGVVCSPDRQQAAGV